ncbi:MAG: hypothetical protein MZV65_32185 [Chromatiales bacterium]|nr:hypothetical protein [Chromatiales bacterium]
MLGAALLMLLARRRRPRRANARWLALWTIRRHLRCVSCPAVVARSIRATAGDAVRREACPGSGASASATTWASTASRCR